MMNNIDNEELMTNIAITVTETAFKNAWSGIKKFFNDLSVKDDIRYRTAYERYLTNTKSKNSKIKTIIYRSIPKDIYSFYICIGVLFNGKTIDTGNINNLLALGNKFIITGTGGIGKSILFKHLFLNTIEETTFIPVLLELRSFNIYDLKDISIYEAIYKSLYDNGFELSEEYFEYSMKEGAYIIFFDGYDEVNRDKTDKITSEIKALCEKYNDNKYFMSSRPSDEFIGWNDFNELKSLELNKEQALNLIKKIEFDESVKDIFYKELDNNLYDKYSSFASNPLLLNIMLLTFQKHASIPEKLNDFYDEAFVTLFNVHDATKDSYVRDIRTGLGCEDFKLIFSYICFKSYFKSEFQFSESKIREYIQNAKNKFDKFNFRIEDYLDDLTQSVCMLVKEGFEYRFSHRSFQEYFAAWYTCKLVDDTQTKLLHRWIEESSSVLYDSYFTMLYDLQSEKVNKIIICPILEDVKKLYMEYGYSLQFLQKLFSGVKLRKGTSHENYSLSLTIKDKYLCRALMLNNKLNNYPYATTKDDKTYEFFCKCANYLNKEKNENYNRHIIELGLDKVLCIISEDELLDNLSWIKNQIEFAIEILGKNNTGNISRKRKVASILEEL